MNFHPLRVGSVDRLCDDAVAVSFEVPPELGDAFRFRPGQHLSLRRIIDGIEERRSYSICAPAGSAPRIGVRRVPGGTFSSWLVDHVGVGDPVEVGTPAGSFTPPAAPGGGLGLIAAGSGITPLLSIATSALGADPSAEVTLVCANRRSDSVMFAEELADLKDRYGPRLHLVHVLSREPTEVDLLSGRLDADRLRAILASLIEVAAIDSWWLCGPLALTGAAAGVLADLGVESGVVHRELFFVDEPPPKVVREPDHLDEATSARIVLHGRATDVPVPAGMSLLDAARRVRGDVPYACKGGVCGTCRARLTGGSATMRRNFALEADEVQRGFVLTCQAVPDGPGVVVDYDG